MGDWISDQIEIIGKSILGAGISLFLVIILLTILWDFLFVLYLFGINFFFDNQTLNLLISLLVIVGIALYVYHNGKKDSEKKENKKQCSLLESLHTELDLISNNEKKGFGEGNLQWFSGALEIGDPLHSVWNINPSSYLSYLIQKLTVKKLLF